jgi:hypothetical protein
MSRAVGILVVVLAGAAGVFAVDPPKLKQLSAADARQAAAWQTQIDKLVADDDLTAAIRLAEQLHRLHKEKQGAEHWQTWDAAFQLEDLPRLSKGPPERRQQLRQARRLNEEAVQLHQRGLSGEAEKLLRQSLALREEALPPGHPDLAASSNNLADSLRAQQKYVEAEQLHRQALALCEKALPPGHPGLANGRNSLAETLRTQGKYVEAEKLYRQALALWEKALPPGHPDLATSMNNLAVTLNAQGKYAEAETLHRQALAVRQKALPPGHPLLANSFHNLAGTLENQGKYAEAEKLYRLALALLEKAMPAGHPLLANSLHGVANALHAQGKYVEAEKLQRQALALYEKALPAGHPDLAGSLNNLAATLRAQGKYAEAEQLCRQTLALYEKALPAGHPDLAQGLIYLAGTLEPQGKYAEAEQLCRQALALRQKALPPGHPLVATSLSNLAVTLRNQEKYTEAERLCRQALALYEKALPPGHPDLATSINNLAGILHAQGKSAEAEQLHRQALAIFEKALPPGHPKLAIIFNNLAINLTAQDKDAEALEMLQRARTGFQIARLHAARTGYDRALFAAAHKPPEVYLATLLAQLGRRADAWQAAESQLGRGLLDDLSALAQADLSAAQHSRLEAANAELAVLEKQIGQAVLRPMLDEAARQQLQQWLKRSGQLAEELVALAAAQSSRQVASLQEVQRQLPQDAALVLWIDWRTTDRKREQHCGCVVRSRGAPAWEALPGRGAGKAWTAGDDALPRQLIEALSRPAGGEWRALARQLSQQRLGLLEPHLQGVRRLIVMPTGWMAAVPVEVLTDRYAVSYIPSCTLHARLSQQHRTLHASLLALGDPTFKRTPPPEPPDHGLYLQLVLPGSAADKAGLRSGDVLLRYNGTRLAELKDVRLVTEGQAPLPIRIWRDGQVQERNIASGKLGVSIAQGSAADAIRKQRQAELVLVQRGAEPAALPGTRLEVQAIVALFDQPRLLLGSEASEQRLDELAAHDELARYRILHLATHGQMHPTRPSLCALLLAQDQLPDPAGQIAAKKKVYDGRLTAEALLGWRLDADLVVLSACETGLGPQGGGDGLLGFSQVLFRQGARSVALSLWKVDDVATALLMQRFYQNLLGKRPGLEKPLGRAAALAEAKAWLRNLRRSEAGPLAAQVGGGQWRADVEKLTLVPTAGQAPAPPTATDRLFDHPYYWAAFILLGDPD